MSKFIMLVGLPASGKSTLANELSAKYNAEIVSSDEIRKELFKDINNQDNNNLVFETVNKRIRDLLDQGGNVIYDATNINRKRRMHFIKNEIKADEKLVYYLNTPMSACSYNDSQRSRKVGFSVIDKMYKTLQIPTKLEGWDEVIFINPSHRMEKPYRDLFEMTVMEEYPDYEILFRELGHIVPEFNEVYEVPQDSSYHSFSISRHIYHTYKFILDNYKNYKGSRYYEVLVAALFHDLGKGHCKTFFNHKGEEKRHASFIGHEFVSAQLASGYLTALGYSDVLVKYVVDLIQFHMQPMNMSEKQESKLRSLLTEEQFRDLMFLHEADLSAK